jgi:phage gp45-like
MTSASRNGPAAWAFGNSELVRHVAGMVRRMIVSLTSETKWQVLGHVLLDKRRETHDAEPFTGIGFYSRPPTGAQAEAVLVFPGGAAVPVIVGLRDEDTRRKMAGDLKVDETQIHNSKSMVRILADGTVEIRSSGGAAVPLATKADLEELANFIRTMTLPVAGGTAGPLAVPGVVPTAAGTTKLKAE